MFGLSSNRRVARLALLLVTLVPPGVLFTGCAADVAVREEPIVGGTLESGSPAVYFLYRLDGASCTAALISPRVVLTARHCVVNDSGRTATPGIFRVYAGSSPRSFFAEYRVSRVEIIPGSTSMIGDGTASDLALLILNAPAQEAPYALARETDGDDLIGVNSTSIGFGQTPSGGSATKYRVTSHVNRYYSGEGLIGVDPAVCQGDSGGPLIGPDNLVYGVASFISSADGVSEPRCGTAPGFYNEVARHLAWIDSVIESTGDVCIPDAEICDGLDNDCNEMVDEGCLAIGTPCDTSDRCVGGLCAETTAGRVCTQACDPLRLELGCSPGTYCATSGCDAYCVPGTLGANPVGTSCAADTECSTGFCRDPGDGMRRCLDFCRLDENDCLGREVCVPFVDTCGGCVDASIVGGTRSLGETCSSASQCRSGICHLRAGVGECATACGPSNTCTEGFVCRDTHCIADRRQPVGGPCIDSADCIDGLCATSGAGSWCTVLCSSDTMCPLGMLCDPTARVCAPDRGLDGAACNTGDDCVSGLCGNPGGGNQCLSFCDRDTACGAGHECRRIVAGGGAVCVATSGGGCTANPAGLGPSRTRGMLMLFGALGVAMMVRRRRRV